MTTPDTPYTRGEMYLSAIADGDSGGIPAVPYTRKEQYLNAIATGNTDNLPETPYTREEMYLDSIARNGGGGGGGGGGGVPLLTVEEWAALTTEQKLAYGLVAIQTGNTGYERGSLVYGAAYVPVVPEEMEPTHSWNASDNLLHTYNFDSATISELPTTHCLALMAQNGTSPEWSASANLLPAIANGSEGNGNWAICYGEKASGDYASTISTGNNWNNSEIVCFCFSGDVNPTVKAAFYAQGTSDTYSYTYKPTENEKLLLVAMRGGSAGGVYSVTGLTLKSHVTSSGGRFNDVYYGELGAENELTISIPYTSGTHNNGSLLVALLKLG